MLSRMAVPLSIPSAALVRPTATDGNAGRVRPIYCNLTFAVAWHRAPRRPAAGFRSPAQGMTPSLKPLFTPC